MSGDGNHGLARVAQAFETGLVVCLTGPESTGKSTLAADLSQALAVPLVSEVAREQLETRLAEGREGYCADDLLNIARAQLAAEQNALAEGTGLVVCDTDLQVIQIWWQEKFGALDPWLHGALAQRTPRRYLLMAPDLPWESDPLRESADDRHRLFACYLQALRTEPHPFAEVFGTGSARFERAMACVQDWLAEPQYA